MLVGKKAILVVNVAQNWGLTKTNYTQMADIYNKYSESGLEILAYPCNQFNGQEPGTNQQIKEYATRDYHAKFPLMSKVEVNGPNACEVYQYLRKNSELYDEKT